MKRVVLIRSNPVNPDPPVEKMANALLRNGYDVTIVAWDRNENYACQTSFSQMHSGVVRIVRFGIRAVYGGGLKKTLPALTKFQERLTRWLFSHRTEYDIIHAFDFDTGFVASICARVLKKELVYHILDYYIASHNLTGSAVGKMVEQAEIGIINRANAVIICTEKRKEQISKAKPRQLAVIHNTPTDHIIDNACNMSIGNGEKLRLVFVGTFGDGRFLREVVNVVRERNDVELHIGGFGDMEKFIVEAADLDENIYYYGRLAYEKTLALEKQCDIMFAMYTPEIPNHRYAAPNKFYEALMLGKPIIMAKDTGFDEIIQQNGIGEIAEYSVKGFHAAIDHLIADREQWPQMQKRARELYDRDFSWTIMETRIEKIYSTL